MTTGKISLFRAPKRSNPEKGAARSSRALSLCSTSEARNYMSYEHAVLHRVLPLGVTSVGPKSTLTVAHCSDSATELMHGLRFATGLAIKLIHVSPELLNEAIFMAYNGDDEQLNKSLGELRAKDPGKSENTYLLSARTGEGELSQFLTKLLDYALARKASDLHLVPQEEGTWVKMRVNGELLCHHEPICSLEMHRQFITRLKVLAQLDTTAKAHPQDGSFFLSVQESKTHLRVSTLPTVHGEKAVIRFIGAQQIIPISELGYDERTLNALNGIIERGEGTVLISGATGSGKTTSLYSIAQLLREKNLSVATLEDPVEVHLPGISQTSINECKGLSYTTCIPALLRQDPDVIILGEMRDSKSAQAAIQAALTGHIVLSSVHARSVFEVLLRLNFLEIDSLSMAQGLELLISQRLLPRLCGECKVIDLARSNVMSQEIYQPVGCKSCDYSGYQGRVLVAESLSIDSEINELILQGKLSALTLKPVLNTQNYSSLQVAFEKLLEAGVVGYK